MNHFEAAVLDRIAKRAFNLFEQAGRPHGQDLDHWLQAETEILSIRPEVQETRDSVTLFAQIPDIPSDKVEICLGNYQAIVWAGPSRDAVPPSSDAGASFRQEGVLLLARWPSEIDPTSAKGTLDGNLLMVVANRMRPI
jgi:hypothetical protein